MVGAVIDLLVWHRFVRLTAGIGGMAVRCACLAARAPVLARAAGCGYALTLQRSPGPGWAAGVLAVGGGRPVLPPRGGMHAGLAVCASCGASACA